MKTPLLFCLLATLASAEPDLGERLRDALYTEEVTRDPEAAASAYEKILAELDRQRPIAASALFRLAEVRRHQEKHDEAIALYQRLLREFPEREAEAKLAGEHLAALGGEVPAPTTGGDPIDQELERLRELAGTAPDVLRRRETLIDTIKTGHLPSVRFLLEHGADPKGERVLQNATERGFTEVVKLLLEKGGKPSQREATRAMDAAIDHGRNATLEFLLDQGFDPNGTYDPGEIPVWLPLMGALNKQNQDAARLLVEHGADPNHSFYCGQNFAQHGVGTLLHEVVVNGNMGLEEARLLLELGADPDPVSPEGGVTPLHLAAKRSHADLVRLLLKHGADPNRRTANPGPANEKWGGNFGAGTSALDLAVQGVIDSGSVGALQVLLDAGGKVTPGLARSIVSPQFSYHPGAMPLQRMLLDRLPDFPPGSPDGSALLQEAADAGIDVRPLIAKGAVPTDDWMMNQHFQGADEFVAFPLLAEKFLFPRLASEDHVTLVQCMGRKVDPLATKSGSSAPPLLARLLLDVDLKFAYKGDHELATQWTLWRKGKDGELTSTPIDLKGDAALPELQWGDIVELRTTEAPGNPAISVVGNQNSGGVRIGESRETRWNIRRHLVVPVTAEVDGHTRKLTLRGDCLLFEPTSDTLPYGEAHVLAPLLWDPGYDLVQLGDREPKPRVIITRKGWGELPWEWGKRGFHFEPGDHLRLETTAERVKMGEDLRPLRICLNVPGTGFGKRYSVVMETISSDDSYITPDHVIFQASRPTIVALIADAYSTAPPFEKDQAPGTGPTPWAYSGGFAKTIPHPDFSAIRIRRMSEKGEDEVIEVDLAKAIASCSDTTTPEEARRSDVPLEPGDIVELPMLSDRSQPWRGFSAEQSRYFHKVLSGSVQIFHENDPPELLQLSWQPVAWRETSAGWLPFQPDDGYATTSMGHSRLNNALSVWNNLLSIERDGTRSPAADFRKRDGFLCDGDRAYRMARFSNTPRRPRPRAVILPR